MIIEAILKVIHGLATSVSSWMRSTLPDAPTLWQDMSDAFTNALMIIPPPVLNFVPIVPTVTAGLTAFAVVLILGAIRFARRMISLFTGGGGMA